MWPARRSRWWAILVPSDWQNACLPKIPDLPFVRSWQTVRSVIDHWPLWPEEEELDLAWSDYEKSFLLDGCFGDPNRFLNLEGHAPTALHSAGNHFCGCPFVAVD